MWSTLLVPLLLLHFSNLHATHAMATAHGGLTVIEGSSTTSSSSSSSTSTTSSTTSSSMSVHSASNLGVSVQRKRHRKRNSSWYDYRNYNENTTALEWMNPCGGSYHTPTATERRRAHRPKQIFNQLKHAAGSEFHLLNNTGEYKGIDIRNMQMWSLHNPNYKFLPKLKPNSTIALKRWYRNMQTYVASFAYLRRVQVNWDRHYLKRESPIAKELRGLLVSSRSMLCELETAVNRTYPSLPATLGRSAAKQRRQTQLPQISRNDMNKRLKLRSKRRPLPPLAAAATTAAAAAATAATTTTTTAAAAAASVVEADSIDMRFVKHHYYKFLRTMWQLLRRESKRERQQRRQRRQRRQQRQRQQQPTLQQQQQQEQLWPQQSQQQQQQRMQLSLANVGGNRNEFNEVSKPSADGHTHTLAHHGHGHAHAHSVGRRERGKRQQPLSIPSKSSLLSSASKLPSPSASASASASISTSASASASTSAATLRHQRRVLRT